MNDVDEVVRSFLDERGLSYETVKHGAYVVRLEGEHKLVTNALVLIGEHSLLVEAFFIRQPDENHADFAKLLLEKNGRTYGVHFAMDHLGDVYLVGRVPLHAVTDDELDRVLGCVLSYADETFDRALEVGFGSAIRREWAWREKRGEPLDNLKAFARFADPARD